MQGKRTEGLKNRMSMDSLTYGSLSKEEGRGA